MIDLAAEHVGFVAASYGVVAAVLVALVLRSVVTARRLKRALAAQGLADPGRKDAGA